MYQINETHDINLTSWLASANVPGCDFSIQNLPIALFKRSGVDEPYRGGIAIGDQVLDLSALSQSGLLSGLAQEAAVACSQTRLNAYMNMGREVWSALRLAVSKLLRENANDQEKTRACLVPQASVEYDVPCEIGDYTDFYTSIHHATSVGKLFRPDNPLLPNYKWIPIGYHGRSSSIGVSGQSFKRPTSQLKPINADTPVVAPCKRLDYELELGIFIGNGNDLGDAIAIDDAEDHVFGICLFNDWSARDVQAWEYQPLGPFLAKNFASTVSPWIVSMEALAPFREQYVRPSEDPQPLSYLSSTQNSEHGAIDIQLEVLLQTEQMRNKQEAPEQISQSNFLHSYWTVAQLVTHHTVNGCNLRAGDLFGSGTQSGPKPEEAGSLLELSEGGKKSIALSNGEERTFIEDGDTVVLRGKCTRPGFAPIGFGEVSSTVLPAVATTK